MYIAALMFVPLLIGLYGLISSRNHPYYRITLREFLAMEIAVIVILTIGYHISRWQAVSDIEIVSGVVTKKEQVATSCEHSYSCHCFTDSKGNTTCQTCYEHFNDYDWVVWTNAMGRTVTIARVNRQGTKEPPRFTAIKIGESVALPHEFSNYIKADPSSVLTRRGVVDFPGLELVKYPNRVYDYYRVNRFLQIGLTDPNADKFNKLLMDLNGELGPKKQVNVVMVVVRSADPNYEYVIQEKWLNGKKNDAIVVFGVSNYPTIDWVRIVSWTKNEAFKIQLRDKLQSIGIMSNPSLIINTIRTEVVSNFERREWEEFNYLMATLQPSTGVTIFLFLLGVAICVGLYVYFLNNDPFGDDAHPPFRYRRRF